MKTCKKSLAILLSLLFAFSAFTLCVNAAETTKTQKLIDALNGKQAVSVTMKSSAPLLGSSTNTFVVKGNALAYEFKGGGLINIRFVLNGGNIYAYLPILPFFYVKTSALGFGLGENDVAKLIKRLTGVTFSVLRYVKSYSETIDGVAYDVEEYYDNATVTAKFCYVGDQLKLLKVTDSLTNSVQNTYFENISFDVSDDVVAVPRGINVTPLFRLLFTTLVTSLLTPA